MIKNENDLKDWTREDAEQLQITATEAFKVYQAVSTMAENRKLGVVMLAVCGVLNELKNPDITDVDFMEQIGAGMRVWSQLVIKDGATQ